MALTAMASVWFAYGMSKVSGQAVHSSCRNLDRLTLLPIFASSYAGIRARVLDFCKYNKGSIETQAIFETGSEDYAPNTNDGGVELANKNISRGGRVWPVFRKYYGLPDASPERSRPP